MGTVLAIDAGTTGVRAVVFGEDGCTLGSAYQELEMRYPRAGWVEQDAEELWSKSRAVITRCLQAAGQKPSDVAAVGVTNQRSSVVAWDARTLEALSPLIVWQDVRTSERCLQLVEQGFFVTANMAVTKLEWIAKNVPAVSEAAAAGRLRFGTPDSFLCARLTGGRHATDHSNASTTGLYAPFERRWDQAILAAVGVDSSTMPEIVDSSGVIALTRKDAVGIEAPLAAMCGDQQSALFGLACREAGLTKCTFGTAAMVDANSGESVTMGGAGTYPLVAWSLDGVATYCVEGTVVTAGAAIQWLRDGIGLVDDATETGTLAARVTDSGGVWVVPAFQGLGTPHSVSTARAMIGGLSRGTRREHVARAFLEGIAHRVADAAECVWEACGTSPALRVDGGASANDILLQMQADLLGIPVERSREKDGAALGAASLAAIATGLWNPNDAVLAWKPQRVFEPSIDRGELQDRRETWRRRVALVIQEAS